MPWKNAVEKKCKIWKNSFLFLFSFFFSLGACSIRSLNYGPSRSHSPPTPLYPPTPTHPPPFHIYSVIYLSPLYALHSLTPHPHPPLWNHTDELHWLYDRSEKVETLALQSRHRRRTVLRAAHELLIMLSKLSLDLYIHVWYVLVYVYISIWILY